MTSCSHSQAHVPFLKNFVSIKSYAIISMQRTISLHLPKDYEECPWRFADQYFLGLLSSNVSNSLGAVRNSSFAVRRSFLFSTRESEDCEQVMARHRHVHLKKFDEDDCEWHQLFSSDQL